MKNTNPLISFVVPVKDEEQSLNELFERIAAEVKQLGREFEIIFIDDGSTDSSWSVIESLVEKNTEQVRGIRFRRNLGKAAALAAGFKSAHGGIVFTMDADLQDDPKEIRRFLAKLDEGYDLISGWKKTRHDPWHKVLPSRVFNKMLSRASGVHLHDHNCGFKCYRAAVVKELNVYGEMHRMLPSLAGIRGFKSTEVEVEHHPRRFGKSKYGVKRFLRGFMDMMTVWFLREYRERPLHLMGGFSVTALVAGAGLFGVGELTGIQQLGGAGIAVAVSAIPLMGLGFMSELLISRRTNNERQLPILEEIPKQTESIIPFAPLAVLEGNEKTETDATPLVLISDDDPNVRRLMAYHLESVGFRVAHAKNGPETIEMARQRPAVILLDLMLPGLDGLQCLRHIRKENMETKVIMVSAHGQIRQAVGAMKMGAFDYISKPFDPDQLVASVRRAVQLQNLSQEYVAMSA